MDFSWAISLGNVITTGSILLSALGFIFMMRSDIKVLGFRLTAVELAIKQLVDVAVNLAKVEGKMEILDERLNIISRRLDSFIQENQWQDQRKH